MWNGLPPDYDDTLSDSGSVSDGGFSPIDKGKARAADERPGHIEFRVLSIDELRQEQQKAVDYVTDMLHLKVSQPTAPVSGDHRGVTRY